MTARITRRQALAAVASALVPQTVTRSKPPKKILVAGAGIGGLSCAWELLRRGHDVTVVEASGRTGVRRAPPASPPFTTHPANTRC